jgi:hypothetical protein
MNKIVIYSIGLFCLAGLAVIVWFMFNKPFNDGSRIANSSVFAQYGDFIGGFLGTLFSVGSFIILYYSIVQQRNHFEKSINAQNKQFDITLGNQNLLFEKERFENRFFEMVKFHRDNVSEMTYTYSKYKGSKYSPENEKLKEFTAEKRKVFKLIFQQFDDLNKECAGFFKNCTPEEIYVRKYLEELHNNKTYRERNVDFKTLAQVDITYLIIFIGLSERGHSTLLNFLEKKYLPSFYKPILRKIALKPKEESDNWIKWENIQKLNDVLSPDLISRIYNDRGQDEALSEPRTVYNWTSEFESYYLTSLYYDDNYEKYYGGHQFRLGHYFRHLFQTVLFIDKSDLWNYHSKYSYIRLLRGQLSTYEQAILFFNSLSQLGRVWELETKLNPATAIELNSHLITKYDLIKNIHSDVMIPNISSSMFYPFVSYESFSSTELGDKRQELVKYFS